MEEKCVYLVSESTGSLIEARVRMIDEWEENPEFVQIVIFSSIGNWEGRSDFGYFHALKKIRAELDPIGVNICCAGCMVNAWQSSMAAQMGVGDRINLLKHGLRPSLHEDTEIFDYAHPSTLGTLSESADFFEAWMESFKPKR
jgi:hypothetical protein